MTTDFPRRPHAAALRASLFAICRPAIAALVLFGCSEGPAATKREENTAVQQVSVVELKPAPLAMVLELPGRISPTRIAEVRARVSGIVMSRKFEQGSDVAEGAVLYEIDDKPFAIELRAAEAALSKATAALDQETANARRKQALAPSGAVSQAQLDVAIAAFHQAEADVAARKADVAKAALNLEYTRVRAPISGRVGRALVTEGALVAQSEHTHVATIQRLNPIYADFTQSAAEIRRLRREFETGALERGSARARLVLDNGEIYPFDGKLLFSDTTVDPGTGQVTLRSEFPNPELALLPGMYVRVQIEQGIDPDALAIPQQAVRRNEAGDSEVFVVGDENRASAVAVRLGRVVDDRWLVLDGVKPGDRVIVDGFQKFAAGDVISPQPWRDGRFSGGGSPPGSDQTASKR
ncbi:MAG TPA: efflux RND transporter periplasmic adaptor subunit [Xanthobacteraceae bacterium]